MRTPERRWLLLLAGCGVAVFVLSFVNAWLVQDRELRGEGFRYVQTWLSAWRGAGMPVLTVAAVAALSSAGVAVLALARPGVVPRWALPIGPAVVLGLALAAVWPVSQSGHASTVVLTPGVLLAVAIPLAIAMVVAAFAVAGVRRAWLAVGAAAVLLLAAGGTGGRWLALQAAEGTGRHWSEGSYTRHATGDQPTETLTIAGERVTIGNRWSGSWEWSGWTVVIDGDPACPESRGTYHAHREGEEDLRFVKVVDTCQDGARAADLETGIWQRDQ